MLNELYVAVKENGYIVARIDRLCKKYNHRNGVDYKQQKMLFRSYCHDTINLFDECFETSMLGMIRCKARVKAYQSIDDLDIRTATYDIVAMLCELKSLVSTMVTIKDLPSCKKLTELSAEDIISKAKDLVKNDIVKAGVGILLLGSKMNDVVKIEDVRQYYDDRLKQLKSEIILKDNAISPIEQYLLDKFNAEIGYCNLAMLKAGIGVTNELKGLFEISKKHIEHFENQQQGNSEMLSGCSI